MVKGQAKTKLLNRFQGSQEVKTTFDQVNVLKEEIKSLKSDANSGGFLASIFNMEPSDQCRQTFPQSIIDKRVRSLLQEGQLDPVVLIELGGGKYLIEDGEVTWRAAHKIVEQGNKKWQMLHSVASTASDAKNVHYRTLLHHLHSEGLNPLDRAESILKEIKIQFDIDQPDAIKLLRNISYQQRKNNQIADQIAQYLESTELDSELEAHFVPEQIKLLTLLSQLQVEISTFINTDLLMLDLAEDIKRAVREQGLSCNHAQAVNRLNGKTLPLTDDEMITLRHQLIREILDQKLGIRGTRTRVKEIIVLHSPTEEKLDQQVNTQKYDTVKSNLEAISIENLTSRQQIALKKLLESKLALINNLSAK